jgi:hypothetical protein
VCEAEGEEASGMHAGVVIAAEQHNRRTPSLIETPPRAPELDVIQKFDVDGRKRVVAAESTINAGPEAEIGEQLAGLVVGPDEELLRVDSRTPLEPDTLRISRRIFHE